MTRSADKYYKVIVSLPQDQYDILRRTGYGGQNLFDLICACSDYDDATAKCQDLGLSIVFNQSNTVEITDQNIIDICRLRDGNDVLITTDPSGGNSSHLYNQKPIYLNLRSIHYSNRPFVFKVGEEVYDVRTRNLSSTKIAYGPLIYVCPSWSFIECRDYACLKRYAMVMYSNPDAPDGEGVRIASVPEDDLISGKRMHNSVDKVVGILDQLKSKCREYQPSELKAKGIDCPE